MFAKIMLFIGGAIILAGSVASIAITIPSEIVLPDATDITLNQRAQNAGWMGISILITTAAYVCLRMYFPKDRKSGLNLSTLLDMLVSLCIGSLLIVTEDAKWLVIWFGFALVAYTDYATRWLFLYGRRKQ